MALSSHPWKSLRQFGPRLQQWLPQRSSKLPGRKCPLGPAGTQLLVAQYIPVVPHSLVSPGGWWHQALTAALGHPGCPPRAAAPFPAPAQGDVSIRKSSSPSPEHRQVTGQVKTPLGLRSHPGSLLGEHRNGICSFLHGQGSAGLRT